MTDRWGIRLPAGLAPLRGRDFAYFWGSSAVGQVASWMEFATTTWLLYEITRSPVLLGLNGVFRAVPVIALSLLGGALADRGSRKILLQVSLIAHLFVVLGIGALVAIGWIAYWHFYVAATITAIFGAFAQPSRMALFPSLIPRDQMQNAVNLAAIPHRLALAVGPAVAGWVIAVSGPVNAYLVAASGLLIAFGSLALVRVPAAVTFQDTSSSLGRLAISGLRYTLRHSLVPAVLILELLVMLFGYNATLLTVFARDILGVGAPGLGLLLSAAGAGAIAGSLLLIATGDIRRKGKVLVASAAAYAVALSVFATSAAFAISLASLFVLGAAEALWGALRFSIIQLATIEAYRGRVMSLLVIGFHGVSQLGQVQTGAVIALLGAPGAALLGAGAIGMTVLAVALRKPELRRFGDQAIAELEPLRSPSRDTPASMRR